MVVAIHKIEVSEYECVHCGYKWINRVNGKDGPMPKKCAKCKRPNWNGKGEGSGYNPITPRERSLRVRLYKFEGRLNRQLGCGRQYRPNELCKKFLSLNPRPTMKELYEALWPLGWDPHRRPNYIPDPDPKRPQKDGTINLKYESPWTADYHRKPDTEYQKLLEEETQKRKEFMKKVIESRGETVPKEKTEEELEEEERRWQEGFSQIVEKYNLARTEESK